MKNYNKTYNYHISCTGMETMYTNRQCLKNEWKKILLRFNGIVFNQKYMKNNIKDSDIRYILVEDVEYPKVLDNLQNDLPFLPERMKIKKFYKLLCNLYNKDNYVAHKRILKQALNHGLIPKKVHRVIKSNQKGWQKPCIDMNTKLRTDAKK